MREQYEASYRLICASLSIARSSCYYKSKKDDSELEAKLRALAIDLPARGFDEYYGRIRLEGLKWNRKRVLRVYRKLGLVKRRPVKRRLPASPAQPLVEVEYPQNTYSMDFMSDRLEDGRQLRVLNIMDDFNRELVYSSGSNSFPAQKVVRALQQVASEKKSYPKKIRVDNGPEFRSAAFAGFCKDNQIEILYIQPGKPTQNAYIERFNRHFREDVLDAYLFESYEQFNVFVDKHRFDFNHNHPHDANGGLPPVVFAQRYHKDLGRINESSKAKVYESG